MTTRRHFLRGLGAILAAPAIVRVSAIMPVRAMPLDGVMVWDLAHPTPGPSPYLLNPSSWGFAFDAETGETWVTENGGPWRVHPVDAAPSATP